MDDLQMRFEKASQAVQKLPKKPDNDTLLKLYAWYKQATTGDASGPRPGAFDLVGQAKFTAWSKVKRLRQK
jgi:acyl-CoA-binding protein